MQQALMDLIADRTCEVGERFLIAPSSPPDLDATPPKSRMSRPWFDLCRGTARLRSRVEEPGDDVGVTNGPESVEDGQGGIEFEAGRDR